MKKKKKQFHREFIYFVNVLAYEKVFLYDEKYCYLLCHKNFTKQIRATFNFHFFLDTFLSFLLVHLISSIMYCG